MVYQMAAMAVTLNDLEDHSPVAGLFKCNPSNICAAQWLNYATEGGGSLFPGETATRLEICIRVYQLLGSFYRCIRIILSK